MKSVENYIKREEVEVYEKWSKIRTETPSLNFDKEWDIKIIPPFGGAVARFLVFKNEEQICSVYLDWYENLGCFGEPYYELYPFEDDIKRYSLKETDELINDIRGMWESAK